MRASLMMLASLTATMGVVVVLPRSEPTSPVQGQQSIEFRGNAGALDSALRHGIEYLVIRTGLSLRTVTFDSVGLPATKAALRDTLLARMGFLYAPTGEGVSLSLVLPDTVPAAFRMSGDMSPEAAVEDAIEEVVLWYRVIYDFTDGTRIVGYALQGRDQSYLFDTILSFPPVLTWLP